MSKKMIKYKNSHDQYITEQQALQLDDFSKLHYVNNQLKKEELFINNELNGGLYFPSPNENIVDMLNQLGSSLRWSIGTNHQVVNDYDILEYRYYDENLQLKPKFSKVVTDSNERLVATVSFGTQTQESMSAFKKFYFGGRQIPEADNGIVFEEDASVSFSFNNDSEIEKIIMNIDFINNSPIWNNVSSFLNAAGDWVDEIMTPDQVSYFTNVEPVIPNF
jgi:hypothetical protein